MSDKDNIFIREIKPSDIEEVKKLIWDTINTCYPVIYSPKVITYWESLHNTEGILKDMNEGFMVVLEKNGYIVATGSLLEDEIRRVYVLPEFQSQGLGKKVMQELEEQARRLDLNSVRLCSSLVSKKFYDAIGYETTEEKFHKLDNGETLHYYAMQKKLKP